MELRDKQPPSNRVAFMQSQTPFNRAWQVYMVFYMQEQESPYPTKNELPTEENTASQDEKKHDDRRRTGLIIPSVTPNPPNSVTRDSAYVNHAEKKKPNTD